MPQQVLIEIKLQKGSFRGQRCCRRSGGEDSRTCLKCAQALKCTQTARGAPVAGFDMAKLCIP